MGFKKEDSRGLAGEEPRMPDQETGRVREELFRLLVENQQDLIVKTDPQGVLLYVNPPYGRLFDKDPAALIGTSYAPLVHPDDLLVVQAAVAGLLKPPHTCTYEERAQTVDGWRWISWNARALVNHQGQVTALIGIGRDITDRKRTEDALRESQQRNQALLEAIPDIIFVFDPEGRVLDVQVDHKDRLYQPQELFLGRHVDDLLPGDVVGLIKESIVEVGQTGQLVRKEYQLKMNGEMRDFESRMVPISNGTFMAVVRDISDRKRAEAELAASQEQLRLFVDANTDLMFLKDLDLRYRMTNRANADFLGRDIADIIGRGDADLMPADAALHCQESDRRVLAEQRPITTEERVGDLIYEVKKVPVTVDGKLTGVAGIIRDITAGKRTEEERARLEAQLHQSQKMESVGRLAGGVAHDFNNMLGVILGHVEMALDGIDPDHPLLQDLEEIRKAAERSADLTRQLLAFARKQTIAPRVLDPAETIDGMIKMLKRLIGEEVHLIWNPPRGLWPVNMDPSQIDQILANLCVNARDAIGGMGSITIDLENCHLDEAVCRDHPDHRCGDFLRLTVSDTGSGMDQETLAKLFEPFFTTKELGKGTGLGLATVYGAVKQNEGFIDVQSEPGKGTVFAIYLPRYTGKPHRLPATNFKPAESGRETILLVEDEPAILNMTRIMLERNGYRVVGAASPGEAIERARRHAGDIHLLMTDVVMPEMNGRDLARSMLALYPTMKRLFMSGYTADVIAHHGVLEEGVHFIQKPFTQVELTSRIRELLAGS